MKTARAAARAGRRRAEAGHVVEGERLTPVPRQRGQRAEPAQVHDRVGHQVEERGLRARARAAPPARSAGSPRGRSTSRRACASGWIAPSAPRLPTTIVTTASVATAGCHWSASAGQRAQEHAQEAAEGGGLDPGRHQRGDGGGRAFVHVRRPHVEGHARDLEAEAHEQEPGAEQGQRGLRPAAADTAPRCGPARCCRSRRRAGRRRRGRTRRRTRRSGSTSWPPRRSRGGRGAARRRRRAPPT